MSKITKPNSPDFKWRMAVISFFFLGLTCLCFIWSSPSQAARFTGAYLYTICASGPAGQEKVKGGHVACQSYISGIIDYHNVLQSLKLAPELQICVPKKTPLNELQKVVFSYLKRNVEHDNFTAAPAVTMALYEHYPCR